MVDLDENQKSQLDTERKLKKRSLAFSVEIFKNKINPKKLIKVIGLNRKQILFLYIFPIKKCLTFIIYFPTINKIFGYCFKMINKVIVS